MTPVVILDSNALHGRRAFTRSHPLELLALARAGSIRLVVPEVVLLELARQWKEDFDASRAALEAIGDVLADIGLPQPAVQLPESGVETFRTHALELLQTKGVEVAAVPEVPLRSLVMRDINTTKPFKRDGTGFRDALIWENVRQICRDLEDPETAVFFVTKNHSDFLVKRHGALSPELRADIAPECQLEVLPSPYELLQHETVKPLARALRTLTSQFSNEFLGPLVEAALSELYGSEVEQVLGNYVGSGLVESPISTALEYASFDEILPDADSLKSDIIDAGDGDLAVRVTVAAECSLEGYVFKSDYFATEDERYSVLEDWNSHMFRASEAVRLRFTLSGICSEGTYNELELTVDEVEDA